MCKNLYSTYFLYFSPSYGAYKKVLCWSWLGTFQWRRGNTTSYILWGQESQDQQSYFAGWRIYCFLCTCDHPFICLAHGITALWYRKLSLGCFYSGPVLYSNLCTTLCSASPCRGYTQIRQLSLITGIIHFRPNLSFGISICRTSRPSTQSPRKDPMASFYPLFYGKLVYRYILYICTIHFLFDVTFIILKIFGSLTFAFIKLRWMLRLIQRLICKNIATQLQKWVAARHDFRQLSQHATAAVCNEREFGRKRTGLQMQDSMATIGVKHWCGFRKRWIDCLWEVEEKGKQRRLNVKSIATKMSSTGKWVWVLRKKTGKDRRG